MQLFTSLCLAAATLTTLVSAQNPFSFNTQPIVTAGVPFQITWSPSTGTTDTVTLLLKQGPAAQLTTVLTIACTSPPFLPFLQALSNVSPPQRKSSTSAPTPGRSPARSPRATTTRSRLSTTATRRLSTIRSSSRSTRRQRRRVLLRRLERRVRQLVGRVLLLRRRVRAPRRRRRVVLRQGGRRWDSVVWVCWLLGRRWFCCRVEAEMRVVWWAYMDGGDKRGRHSHGRQIQEDA